MASTEEAYGGIGVHNFRYNPKSNTRNRDFSTIRTMTAESVQIAPDEVMQEFGHVSRLSFARGRLFICRWSVGGQREGRAKVVGLLVWGHGVERDRERLNKRERRGQEGCQREGEKRKGRGERERERARKGERGERSRVGVRHAQLPLACANRPTQSVDFLISDCSLLCVSDCSR
eukprot:3013051-Rhodomonas_salina.1